MDAVLPTEKTFGFIKPDLVADGYEEELIDYIQRQGFTIVIKDEKRLSRDEAELFYAEHEGKEFFERLIDYVTQGPIVAFVLAKEDAISDYRELMGPTDPGKAKLSHPQSIRALYGRSVTLNGVHGSDSVEAAQREISSFFPNVISGQIPDPQDYIKQHLEFLLAEGLTTLVKEKPADPLKWFAQWLHDHNPNKPSVTSTYVVESPPSE